MKPLPLFALLLGIAAIIMVALAVAGCVGMLYSDGAYALRKNQRANAEALAVAKVVSRQKVQAPTASGEALVRRLSGNTHVSEFRKQTADAKPYFTTYEYFGPDGIHIVRDTYSRRSEGYQAKGHWRVDRDVLCVTDREDDLTKECFTVRLTPANVIEFWYHRPGEASHGLFAREVAIVRPGLQTPEYTTTSSPYER